MLVNFALTYLLWLFQFSTYHVSGMIALFYIIVTTSTFFNPEKPCLKKILLVTAFFFPLFAFGVSNVGSFNGRFHTSPILITVVMSYLLTVLSIFYYVIVQSFLFEYRTFDIKELFFEDDDDISYAELARWTLWQVTKLTIIGLPLTLAILLDLNVFLCAWLGMVTSYGIAYQVTQLPLPWTMR